MARKNTIKPPAEKKPVDIVEESVIDDELQLIFDEMFAEFSTNDEIDSYLEEIVEALLTGDVEEVMYEILEEILPEEEIENVIREITTALSEGGDIKPLLKQILFGAMLSEAFSGFTSTEETLCSAAQQLIAKDITEEEIQSVLEEIFDNIDMDDLVMVYITNAKGTITSAYPDEFTAAVGDSIARSPVGKEVIKARKFFKTEEYTSTRENITGFDIVQPLTTERGKYLGAVVVKFSEEYYCDESEIDEEMQSFLEEMVDNLSKNEKIQSFLDELTENVSTEEEIESLLYGVMEELLPEDELEIVIDGFMEALSEGENFKELFKKVFTLALMGKAIETSTFIDEKFSIAAQQFLMDEIPEEEIRSVLEDAYDNFGIDGIAMVYITNAKGIIKAVYPDEFAAAAGDSIARSPVGKEIIKAREFFKTEEYTSTRENITGYDIVLPICTENGKYLGAFVTKFSSE